MRFGDFTLDAALGGRLAHSLHVPDGARVRKGTSVDAALIERLREAGVERVTVALPDPDDVDEDSAAARLASAFVGAHGDAAERGLRVAAASTGRANVYATRRGLFLFERRAVLAANAVDERLTLATVAEDLVVAAGRMVATIKIIPYAVPDAALRAACLALRDGRARESPDSARIAPCSFRRCRHRRPPPCWTRRAASPRRGSRRAARRWSTSDAARTRPMRSRPSSRACRPVSTGC